jgi:hypothetical protein
LLRLPRRTDLFLELARELELDIIGPEIRRWRIPRAQRAELACPRGGLAAALASETGKIAVLDRDGNITLAAEQGQVHGTTLSAINEPMVRADITANPRLRITSDGEYLAIAGDHVSLLVMYVGAVDKQKPRAVPITIKASRIVDLSFSSRPPKLAVASKEEGIFLIDVNASYSISHINVDHRGCPFSAVTFTPDGVRLLCAQRDGTVFSFVVANREHETLHPSLSVSKAQDADSPHSIDHIIATGLADAEAIAAGSNGWPLAVAGGGRLLVLERDGTSFGPWRLPDGAITALAFTEDYSALALIVGRRLLIIHVSSGINLLDGDEAHMHAAIGIARGIALIWGVDDRRISICGFERSTEEVGR